MSAPVVPERPPSWYRSPLGVAYLVVLGLVGLATLVTMIIPTGPEKGNKPVVLIVLCLALDVLMCVPLVRWVSLRNILRLSRSPAADLLLGLALFAVAEAAVVILVFFACAGTIGG